MKIIATNREGFRDYDILEALECGIELKGSEVKSARDGRLNLKDSFARIDKNEVILYNLHISPYAQASYLNVEPTRVRRLLLHRKQISKLIGQVNQRGCTLVPLKIYFNAKGLVKVELALAKGKKFYDRREDIKRRETDLAIRRAIRNRRK
ncbi:MAG: SsrA-binding protein SmpB [Candidatus Omnitrophota bacterium]